ncbi:MAG: phosphate ABC transporter permease, partial [Gammaproteobacteria bacterium]|nr:phosphate ABC transporter permease [Gammaproteobacteria bacterium]
MFFNLLQRDLRSRFIGSFSGWLWLLVNPLLLLGVYALVFGVIFRARAPEGLDVPFIAWLAVGLWPWLAFSDAIQRASESIPQHAA